MIRDSDKDSVVAISDREVKKEVQQGAKEGGSVRQGGKTVFEEVPNSTSPLL